MARPASRGIYQWPAEARRKPAAYGGGRYKIDEHRQHDADNPPPRQLAKEPEQDFQIADKHLRHSRSVEGAIEHATKALAPHHQHNDDGSPAAQLADAAAGRARKRQQPRYGQKEDHAAISGALAGEETTGNYCAADYEKKTLPPSEHTKRVPQLSNGQQPAADPDATAEQYSIYSGRNEALHCGRPTRRLRTAPGCFPQQKGQVLRSKQVRIVGSPGYEGQPSCDFVVVLGKEHAETTQDQHTDSREYQHPLSKDDDERHYRIIFQQP